MTDPQIIDLYRKRHEDAVAETQKKYGRLFRSVAFGILRSNEDAEEVENDTYAKLWLAIPPADPADLAAYGCRIARNEAINRYKAATAEKRAHVVAVTEELDECIPSGGSDLADMAALSAAITKFLASERPDRRIIFVRRYFYMDKTSDIAHLLHIPEATVRMTLHRLRKRFGKFLEGEGFEI